MTVLMANGKDDSCHASSRNMLRIKDRPQTPAKIAAKMHEQEKRYDACVYDMGNKKRPTFKCHALPYAGGVCSFTMLANKFLGPWHISARRTLAFAPKNADEFTKTSLVRLNEMMLFTKALPFQARACLRAHYQT